MTSGEFAIKWAGSTRNERAAAQEHFIDLCRMLGVPTPNEADPTGQHYAFEKGVEKVGGGDGFADVWKRGHFAWEYKGKRKNMKAAYQQLLQYREALENPPILIVCDLDRFEIHTNFTNTPATVHTFTLRDLLDKPEEPLRILRAVMKDPEALRPGKTREELTAEAAKEFASLAFALRDRDHEPHEVAHFLNKLLFCMFAQDAGLLPAGLLERLIDGSRDNVQIFTSGLSDLFSKMSNGGGLFGTEPIDWFNGGLFSGGDALPLTRQEVAIVRRASLLDWSQVEPAIFGTLFERGLDPDKRSQLGAHYTDRDSIMRVIEPVLIEPLRRDFDSLKDKVAALLSEGRRVTTRTPIERNPTALYNAFLMKLRRVRVLDPACGSGNFLYLALQALKDFEREVTLWASLTFQVPIEIPQVGPSAVLGIELNSYAAELARVVIWIGEIQWMIANGFSYQRDPILRPLNNIECRDAVVDLSDPANPQEPTWPTVDVIVGNPPFVGGKLLRTYLGNDYVDTLFKMYKGRVPAEADLVCYWHEKARAMIADGVVSRAGLLATQGIRGGANRRVLQKIRETGDIFMAWSDEPWVVEGAHVHVSIVGFDNGSETKRFLDGRAVPFINADLTADLDVTKLPVIRKNLGIAFMGDTKGGPFDIAEDLALEMLASPNADGRNNADVVRPWANGFDVTRRSRRKWIIDFGEDMSLEEAALYEKPFEYVKAHVFPKRADNRREAYAQRWWIHAESRPAMRRSFGSLARYLATPRVAKYRLFAWLPTTTLPDSQLIVFARDDDYFFGVLHSRPHEVWGLRLGTQLETRPRYTPTTTFEKFPMPQPTAAVAKEIAAAGQELNRLREGWLNPPGAEDAILRRRTLTNLYNERPTWLDQAHARLDAAVYAAYEWPYPLSEDEILSRLVDLNLSGQVDSTSTSIGGDSA
ncbi:DNA methyltransferase [Micromonospora sp. NPDC005298]|uniref:class I SAM-dependent DNA methyltransferase n=1 Tax=Micromonospora sp. NPDC005298 TaxID=3156873 RepID=UPI0033A790AD